MLPQGCRLALQCCRVGHLKLASALSMLAGTYLPRICALQKDLRIACEACCGVDCLMPINKHWRACHMHVAARHPCQPEVSQEPLVQSTPDQ